MLVNTAYTKQDLSTRYVIRADLRLCADNDRQCVAATSHVLARNLLWVLVVRKRRQPILVLECLLEAVISKSHFCCHQSQTLLVDCLAAVGVGEHPVTRVLKNFSDTVVSMWRVVHYLYFILIVIHGRICLSC